MNDSYPRPNARKSGPGARRSAVLNARVTPETLARIDADRGTRDDGKPESRADVVERWAMRCGDE